MSDQKNGKDRQPREHRDPRDPHGRRTAYPYIHPEPLHPSEHLAVDAEDIFTFINHEDDNDEGPVIISDVQAP